jgi:hypothetical protein
MIHPGLRCVVLATLTLAACGGTPGRAPAVASRSEGGQLAAPTNEHRSPAPKEGLSPQLGGMRFGMDADAFTVSCRGAEGILSRADEIDLTCSLAPAPLRASGGETIDLSGRIAGKFCGPGATVCELAYMFDTDADAQTAAVVDMLVAKYGPPVVVEGHEGSDPMAQCQKTRTVHFARVWKFGTAEARLVFDCDLRVTADTHELTLFYDDENGVRHRTGEHADARGK